MTNTASDRLGKNCSASPSNTDRYYKAFCESASHPIPSGPRPGSDGLKDICHPPGSATLLSAPLALSSATHSDLPSNRPSLIALITLASKHCIFHCIESSMGISFKSTDCFSVMDIYTGVIQTENNKKILMLNKNVFSSQHSFNVSY